MSAKYSLHMESTMKKTGFTLAELLITLVVIGIISAITLPAINKLMPDKNKINCPYYKLDLKPVKFIDIVNK